MNQKTFYFIRHGQTDWNRERRLQGRSNTTLNLTGRNQAKELGFWLMSQTDLFNHSSTIIVTSPLKRAYETAEVLGDVLRLKIQPVDGLQEIFFGEVEGKTYAEAEELLGLEHWQKWNSQKLLYPEHCHPGGESAGAAIARFETTLKELLELEEYTNILVITHGSIMNKFIGKFLLEKTPKLDNCCCIKVNIPVSTKFSDGQLQFDKIY